MFDIQDFGIMMWHHLPTYNTLVGKHLGLGWYL
jgi:hypothetical protein